MEIILKYDNFSMRNLNTDGWNSFQKSTTGTSRTVNPNLTNVRKPERKLFGHTVN